MATSQKRLDRSDAAVVLVLNAGSSSLKFQLFGVTPGGRLSRRIKGAVAALGTPNTRFRAQDGDNSELADEPWANAIADDAEKKVFQWLTMQLGRLPDAVGHRVVHGGIHLAAPVKIDDAVIAEMQALTPLAPLHQPHNLAPIRAIRSRHPELPQVACFDTAFHRTHPALVDRLPIPLPLHEAGIRHYGFHGLSYEFIVTRLPDVAPALAKGRAVVAHLGNGASACAIVAGRSVDTTMSFTALDGLPMGTRPGRLDPGVVLYLMQQGWTAERIEHLLYHECGLQALSGISSDVRVLSEDTSDAARFALEYLAYHVAGSIASLASAMGGLDGVVFTAGIGEHAAPLREAVLRRCAWLGIAVDPARNNAAGPCITAPESAIPAYVIPTDEELMIGRHTVELLSLRPV